jgi:hypothetical protein
MKKVKSIDEYLSVRISKTQARFKRIKNPKGADVGLGHYFLLLAVTATKETVYVPLSISSGKKVSGFMYQIEGTATGTLATADVSLHENSATQVTLGTLLYAKIDAGKTATFRIQVDIKGKIGKRYTIQIYQISYKSNPSDARYKKFLEGVYTRTLAFS